MFCQRKDTSNLTVSLCFIRPWIGTGTQLPHKISFCEKSTNQINTKPLKQGRMRVSVVISVFPITGGEKHRFALWGTQSSQVEIQVGLKVHQSELTAVSAISADKSRCAGDKILCLH